MRRNPAAETTNRESRMNAHAGRQSFCQLSRRADEANVGSIGHSTEKGESRNYQSSRFDSAGAAATSLRRIVYVLWLLIRGYRR